MKIFPLDLISHKFSNFSILLIFYLLFHNFWYNSENISSKISDRMNSRVQCLEFRCAQAGGDYLLNPPPLRAENPGQFSHELINESINYFTQSKCSEPGIARTRNVKNGKGSFAFLSHSAHMSPPTLSLRCDIQTCIVKYIQISIWNDLERQVNSQQSIRSTVCGQLYPLTS